MNLKLLLVVLAVILSFQYVSASYITLQTTVTSNSTGSTITIMNKGDEPAYNLQVSLIMPLTTLKSKVNPKLDMNIPSSVTFPYSISSLKPGTYPLITIIDYTDANNYPFSAISTSLLNVASPSSSNLVLSMQPIDLSGKNKLKLQVKNLADKDIELRAKIIVPKELTIEDEKSLKLDARSQKTLTFKIEDFSARQDSIYAVFAVVEYEDSLHYTSITSAQVKIVKDIGIPANILIFSLLVLLAMFIIYKFKRKKHESQHNNPDIK